MKKYFFTLILILFLAELYAQDGCLPDGIIFTSQAQIDSFPSNYPGCMVIEGDVVILEEIEGEIISLDSLYQITAIEGDLRIGGYSYQDSGNSALTSLKGLENLISIEGDLTINNNENLLNLTGLESLTLINGHLILSDNDALVSLNGLEALSTLGGYLAIGTWEIDPFIGLILHGNPSLTSIAALQGLDTIGGDYLFILDNDQLETLNGLNNIHYLGSDSIDAEICIGDNEVLNSIEGLENLEFNNLVENEDFDLRISNNPNLSVCNNHAVCGMISLTDFQSFISNNAAGCNNLQEVKESCEPCLPDGITFSSQAQLDSFWYHYPGCKIIQGDVLIQEAIENDITNFGTLWLVSSIQGSFSIEGNNALEGSDFLLLLSSIDGNLNILNNAMLTSLSGLDNLDHSTIDTLILQGNANLSICDIQPICDYLENGGEAEIENNASGCNTQQEIEDACQAVSVNNLIDDHPIRLFPNPTSGRIRISELDNSEWKFVVRDAVGQTLIPIHELINGETNLSALSPGLYFIELNDGQQTIIKRIVKQ